MTASFSGSANSAGFPIEIAGSNLRLYRYDRTSNKQTGRYVTGISLATPTIFFRLLKQPVDLLIVNEFSLFSIYAALAGRFRKASVLCLVESRPRFKDPLPLRFMRRISRRLFVRLADAFLTNNRAGYEYLTEELGVAPARIVTKPYLTSSAQHAEVAPKARQPRPPGSPVRFLYVGDLVKRKGLHLALESFSRVHAKHPSKFTLQLVGDGPYQAALEHQAAELGLAEAVEFSGRRPYEDMPAIYADADVFVFPSLGDYRALAPFEALSAGLPILSSVHDGGSTETVEVGCNGFVFDPEDPSQLAAQLMRILEHPELLARFSRRSLEMARNYSLDMAVDNLLSACTHAVGGCSSRSFR